MCCEFVLLKVFLNSMKPFRLITEIRQESQKLRSKSTDDLRSLDSGNPATVKKQNSSFFLLPLSLWSSGGERGGVKPENFVIS